jgi:outer membrane protein assembly factor BamA
MKTLCITAMIIVISTVTASTQTQRSKGDGDAQTIEKVIIRGNRRISESTIKSWITTSKNDVYRPEKLSRDASAIFATGHFIDVVVSAEDGTDGGKVVTFEVRERSLIRDVEFEGIDSSQQTEVTEEWDKRRIHVSKGSEYDPLIVQRAAKIMQDVLNAKENKRIKIIPYIEEQNPSEVLVTFKVSE